MILSEWLRSRGINSRKTDYIKTIMVGGKPAKKGVSKMIQNVIVLSAQAYSFTDKKTNKIVEATSVRFNLTEDLTPCVDTENNVKGHMPAKAKLAYGIYETMFPTVPAIYEAELAWRVNSKGETVITAKSFKFLCGFTVNKVNGAGGSTKISLANATKES
jgi:hypothetical protein